MFGAFVAPLQLLLCYDVGTANKPSVTAAPCHLPLHKGGRPPASCSLRRATGCLRRFFLASPPQRGGVPKGRRGNPCSLCRATGCLRRVKGSGGTQRFPALRAIHCTGTFAHRRCPLTIPLPPPLPGKPRTPGKGNDFCLLGCGKRCTRANFGGAGRNLAGKNDAARRAEGRTFDLRRS